MRDIDERLKEIGVEIGDDDVENMVNILTSTNGFNVSHNSSSLIYDTSSAIHETIFDFNSFNIQGDKK